ncbi:MFS transporter [Skermania sp. ID1734]|uniref:MFS transporter n=1 Tax=Skermania sp. ID1734 TaxID=2597516 RepID=UPI00117D36D6|nr:MFS transporter [Skermania sp. ID1734]TSD99206.1 MFS transporter [Skermania sp. ID1734]
MTRLGRQFGWLWGAYAVSTAGTWLAFDALPLIAVLVLHTGPAAVSALAAAGLAAGALLAIPLGPWIEFRRKRPVMIWMDVTRCVAMLSVPIAYAFGWLSFVQLVLVTIVVAAADIAFNAASGAFVKSLVRQDQLLVANARFESTMWTSIALGPPLGGAAIGMFGPVTTVLANAGSFLASALGLRAIRDGEAVPTRDSQRLNSRDVLAGWRYILAHRSLRLLLANTISVNGLIMATAPLMAVLMLRDLGFAPWQYGLAFGAPCVGGLIGSRLARGLTARFGTERVLRVAGTLRACWLLGLAFVRPGAAGIVLVILVELGLVTCAGVFNPVFATYRLEHTADDVIARVLAAWSVTSKATIAVFTALWGVLATVTGPRTAVAVAGLLALATPLLLRQLRYAPRLDEQVLAP